MAFSTYTVLTAILPVWSIFYPLINMSCVHFIVVICSMGCKVNSCCHLMLPTFALCSFNTTCLKAFFKSLDACQLLLNKKMKRVCICDSMYVCVCVLESNTLLRSSLIFLIFWLLVASLKHYDTDIQTHYAERATQSIMGRWHMAEKVVLHVVLPMLAGTIHWAHDGIDPGKAVRYLLGMKWPSRRHVNIDL